MKHLLILPALTSFLFSCSSKSDKEMLIGTWKETEFVYLADMTSVLPYDEFGYETSYSTYDGTNVSSYNVWYGTATEPTSSTYTIDEENKKLSITSEYGTMVYDYSFPDENTLVFTFSVDNKSRRSTYKRENAE